MKAEKHIMPILLIIIVLIALVSVYAWFSFPTDPFSTFAIKAGTVTSFGFSDIDETDEDLMYMGQPGYYYDSEHNEYVEWNNADAPYNWYRTVTYQAEGNSTLTVTLILEKATIIFPNKFVPCEFLLFFTFALILGFLLFLYFFK